MVSKKLLLLILYFLSLAIFACNTQDDKKVAVIKTVYAKNDSIWRNENDAYKMVIELASLYKEYCSIRFKNELLEEQQRMGLDHDLITMDWLMDENSMKTIKIQKVSDYVFNVLYVTKMEDPTGKMKEYNVILRVKLTKEKNDYKIDNVIDLSSDPVE